MANFEHVFRLICRWQSYKPQPDYIYIYLCGINYICTLYLAWDYLANYIYPSLTQYMWIKKKRSASCTISWTTKSGSNSNLIEEKYQSTVSNEQWYNKVLFITCLLYLVHCGSILFRTAYLHSVRSSYLQPAQSFQFHQKIRVTIHLILELTVHEL